MGAIERDSSVKRIGQQEGLEQIKMNRFKWIARGGTARKGFTLIELLVVILIIAILAALIVPRLVSRTGQAKIAKAQADIATLRGLIDQFRIDCDRYPTNDEGLGALTTPPSDVQGWKGPYLEKLPQDPWNHDYIYQTPGNAGTDSFLVESYGADGQQGGDGDNADISSSD